MDFLPQTKQYMNDKISEAFGLTPLENKSLVQDIKKETALVKRTEVKEDSDYEYVRENLKGLIEKGTKAIDNLLQLGVDTESLAIYEILPELLKVVGAQNVSLINIQEKIKTVKEKHTEGMNIEKAVFVGSAADLLKALKEGDE